MVFYLVGILGDGNSNVADVAIIIIASDIQCVKSVVSLGKLRALTHLVYLLSCYLRHFVIFVIVLLRIRRINFHSVLSRVKALVYSIEGSF